MPDLKSTVSGMSCVNSDGDSQLRETSLIEVLLYTIIIIIMHIVRVN